MGRKLVVQYVGDGARTAFPLPTTVATNEELIVTVAGTMVGVWTFTNGVVTMATAPASGSLVDIFKDSLTGGHALPLTQVYNPATGLQGLSTESQQVLANSGLVPTRLSLAVHRCFGTPQAGGGTGQREHQSVLNSASRPIAYRVLMQNLEATPPTNITATACGSTTLGSPTYVLPTGGAYAPQTWAGSATLASGPSRLSATNPGTDNTADLIPINVPDRTDGGSGFLMFVRVNPGTGNFSYSSTSNAVTGVNLNIEANAGRVGPLLSSLRNSTSSCTAGNEALFNSGAIDAGTLVSANLCPLYQLEVLYETGQRFIYVGGDSIAAGSQTTSGIFSAPMAAAFAAGYAGVNDGISGQTTAQYQPRVLSFLASSPNAPTRVHYPFWTPNDFGGGVVTAAGLLAAKGRLAAVLIAVGRNPQIEGLDVPTPWPWDALDAANDAVRLQARAWLLGLKHPKLNVIDVEPLGDGATPVRWKAGYSPDGLHPGPIAAGAYADIAAKSLQKFG